MTSRSGELIQWNNNGGYGFVRDGTGRDFYVHVSKVAGGRPKLGDTLSFEVQTSKKGRPSAVNVVITGTTQPVPVPVQAALRPNSSNVSRYTLGLRTAAATMMTLLILWAIGAHHVSPWISVVYAGMGLASALLYRFDKLYAMTKQWRVSESNLHIMDFSFGIIGGLCAQEVYRHKTVKPRFVATTWAIALFHTVVLAFLAFGWFDAVVRSLVRFT